MLELRNVPMGGNLKDFLDVTDVIYRDDRCFVRPLDMDLGDRLNPKKNPFFEHAEGTVFLAYKDGRCVGRATAQVDKEHLERHRDDTGFFGFLDTVDDEEVARELLARAEGWLRDRGMKRARGPMSLSINEEMGCLIEGFDTPPMIMTPHHRPYQAGLIEKAGYTKCKDVYAWRYRVGDLSARVRRARDELAKLPELSARPVNMKDLERDVRVVVDVFNDAWSENWGFCPLTRAEVAKMAADFKLILIPDLTRIVLIDGEPAAVALAIPNVNEMIADLRGKLFPLGLLKLLYRLKVRGPRSGRLAILGVRKRFRAQRKYAPLSAFLYAEMNDAGKKLGIETGELSWTLEDNGPVNAGIRMMGGEIYKKYRVFDKILTA